MTVTVTVFAPSAQVAAAPFVTAVSPTMIPTVAPLSAGVAVIVFVAFVVVAEYDVTPASKTGDNASEPIVSPDRSALKGLRLLHLP